MRNPVYQIRYENGGHSRLFFAIHDVRGHLLDLGYVFDRSSLTATHLADPAAIATIIVK